MGRLTILTAAKNAIIGTYERTYVYPDDFADRWFAPKLPFVTVEQAVDVLQEQRFAAADWFPNQWTMRIMCVTVAGEIIPPSPADVTARLATYPHQDTLAGLILNDPTFGGVVRLVGGPDVIFTHTLAVTSWYENDEYVPMFGTYFDLQVIGE